MEQKTVLYQAREGVATVTLNRPESLNALNAAMGAELLAALKAAAADPQARAMVLTGAGRGFCSGGDLKAMAAGLAPSASTTQQLGAILHNFHHLLAFLYALEIPVVGALHGPVVGAGMSMALACDFRIAAEDATFSQAFMRIGLTPDGGSTWLLPRMVGPARAAQLTMTGETIDAQRAFEWGLLNQVTASGQHLSQAMEVARGLAASSAPAMQRLKRLLRVSERQSFSEQLDSEAEAQVANADSAEFRAALAAFIGKKAGN